MVTSVLEDSLHVQFGGVSRFYGGQNTSWQHVGHSRIEIPWLWTAQRKKHPNSAPQVLHIFISKCPLPGHRMTHSNSRNSSFFRSRCKDSLCFLNSSLELKESEESGECLHLYVFLMTCWQSPKGSPSQTTYCHSLSPSLEYCWIPACTPICLRMVLAEL